MCHYCLVCPHGGIRWAFDKNDIAIITRSHTFITQKSRFICWLASFCIPHFRYFIKTIPNQLSELTINMERQNIFTVGLESCVKQIRGQPLTVAMTMMTGVSGVE